MTSAPESIRLVALPGIPAVRPGDDLPALIRAAAQRASIALTVGALVVAQKIVSKAEGRLVDLNDIEPSAEARSLAYAGGKDARLAELILRESNRVVRDTPTVIIVEHRSGIVLAAGADEGTQPEELGEHEIVDQQRANEDESQLRHVRLAPGCATDCRRKVPGLRR